MPLPRRQEERPASLPQRPAPAPNCRRNPRPKVSIKQLGHGCIVWLPAKDEASTRKIKCIRENCCASEKLNDGGYDHPVLVLEIKQDSTCSFAQVTSKQRSRYRPNDRLAIRHDAPADPEAPVISDLYLEKGEMNSLSYVIVEHIYDVPVSQLRTCSFLHQSKPFDTRLTRQSYKYLVQQLDLEVDNDWVSTKFLLWGLGGYQCNRLHTEPVEQGMHRTPGVRNIAQPGRDNGHTTRQLNPAPRPDIEANGPGQYPSGGSVSLRGFFVYLVGFLGVATVAYLFRGTLMRRGWSLAKGMMRQLLFG